MCICGVAAWERARERERERFAIIQSVLLNRYGRMCFCCARISLSYTSNSCQLDLMCRLWLREPLWILSNRYKSVWWKCLCMCPWLDRLFFSLLVFECEFLCSVFDACISVVLFFLLLIAVKLLVSFRVWVNCCVDCATNKCIQYIPVGSRMSSILIYFLISFNSWIKIVVAVCARYFSHFIAYNLQTLSLWLLRLLRLIRLKLWVIN